MAKNRQRKYDPSRQRQRTMPDVLAHTFFYHGSMMDSVGALCGNLKYTLTNAQAKAILDKKHTWSGIVLAFCDSGLERYTRAEYVLEKTPIDKHTLDKILTEKQQQLLNKLNLNSVCSTGYFIVPDHRIDIETQRDAITTLFEQENPYDYTVTVLAALSRESQLKQEAA